LYGSGTAPFGRNSVEAPGPTTSFREWFAFKALNESVSFQGAQRGINGSLMQVHLAASALFDPLDEIQAETWL
jgi:hypothetical protein